MICEKQPIKALYVRFFAHILFLKQTKLWPWVINSYLNISFLLKLSNISLLIISICIVFQFTIDILSRVLFRRGRYLLQNKLRCHQPTVGGAKFITNQNGATTRAPPSICLMNDNTVIRARLLRDSQSDQQPVISSLQRIERSIDKLDNTLQKLSLQTPDRRGERDSVNQDNITEWRIVSSVLDRLFFILYICAIVASLITLFPRPAK